MAITNHERVGKSLELLKAGLGPFVDRKVRAAVAANSNAGRGIRPVRTGFEAARSQGVAARLQTFWTGLQTPSRPGAR